MMDSRINTDFTYLLLSFKVAAKLEVHCTQFFLLSPNVIAKEWLFFLGVASTRCTTVAALSLDILLKIQTQY
jgi:hypothetical protein